MVNGVFWWCDVRCGNVQCFGLGWACIRPGRTAGLDGSCAICYLFSHVAAPTRNVNGNYSVLSTKSSCGIVRYLLC